MDQMNKFGEDSMDVALNSFGGWSKNAQAIASEVADYSKKSIDDSAAAWERLHPFLGSYLPPAGDVASAGRIGGV